MMVSRILRIQLLCSLILTIYTRRAVRGDVTGEWRADPRPHDRLHPSMCRASTRDFNAGTRSYNNSFTWQLAPQDQQTELSWLTVHILGVGYLRQVKACCLQNIKLQSCFVVCFHIFIKFWRHCACAEQTCLQSWLQYEQMIRKYQEETSISSSEYVVKLQLKKCCQWLLLDRIRGNGKSKTKCSNHRWSSNEQSDASWNFQRR